MPPVAYALDVGETAIKVLSDSHSFLQNLSASERLIPQMERLGLSVTSTTRNGLEANALEGQEWIQISPLFKASDSSVAAEIMPGLGKVTRISRSDGPFSVMKTLTENPNGIEGSQRFQGLGFHVAGTHPDGELGQKWIDFTHNQRPVSIYKEYAEKRMSRDVFNFGKEVELPLVPLNKPMEKIPLRSATFGGHAIDTWSGMSGNTKTMHLTTIVRDKYGNLEFSNDLARPLLRGEQGIALHGSKGHGFITSLTLRPDNKIMGVADVYDLAAYERFRT